ncbi:MAG: hypothetical protein WHT65_10260 [Pseudothermotoga sp.]
MRNLSEIIRVYNLSLDKLYQIARFLNIEVDLDVLLVESETLYEFHQLTERPYHIGAVYTDGVIVTQPFDILIKKDLLEQTIVHELLHHMFHKNFDMPKWFEEGLILYLTGERLENLKGEHRVYLDRFMREVSYEDIPNLVSRYRNDNGAHGDLGP